MSLTGWQRALDKAEQRAEQLLAQISRHRQDPARQLRALQALADFSGLSSIAKEAVCVAGGEPTLVQLISQPGSQLELQALRTLAGLATGSTPCRRAVCCAGGAGAPVQLIDSGTGGGTVQQELALAAVVGLATSSHECTAALVSAGAPDALVELINSSTDAAVQRQAASCLVVLAGVSEASEAAVLRAGAPAALVRLIISSNSAVQQWAVKALAGLAAGSTCCREAVCRAGGADALVQLISSSDIARPKDAWQRQMHEQQLRGLGAAAATLADLAAGSGACEAAVLSAGAPAALVQLISSADTKPKDAWQRRMREQCVQALKRLAAGNAACKQAIQAAETAAKMNIWGEYLRGSDEGPPLRPAAAVTWHQQQQQAKVRAVQARIKRQYPLLAGPLLQLLKAAGTDLPPAAAAAAAAAAAQPAAAARVAAALPGSAAAAKLLRLLCCLEMWEQRAASDPVMPAMLRLAAHPASARVGEAAAAGVCECVDLTAGDEEEDEQLQLFLAGKAELYCREVTGPRKRQRLEGGSSRVKPEPLSDDG